jgi:PIN domain nuclease of toxin-antitoxin system
MRVLLDSHLLVWISEDSPKLPKAVRLMLEEEDHSFFFSAVSLWELAIKSSLGKRGYLVNVRQLYSELVDHRYGEISLSTRHAFALENLPAIHKDPFDRILIAQAMSEGITLLTSDETVALYNAPVQLVR